MNLRDRPGVLYASAVPSSWFVALVILVVCLLASMVIAVVKL